MASKHSRTHHKKNLTTPPENWQEAMDRGVFLLDEHNRGFVEYISPEVHLPASSPKSVILQSMFIIVLAVFGIGWLYSINYEYTRGSRETGAPWWFFLVTGGVVLGIGLFVAYRINSELQRKRALVLEGRLIFAPISKCIVVTRFWRDVRIHLVYDFESPVTNRPLLGRFVGDAVGTEWCPADGAVAAILFKNDKEYQAL
jgi:hypothetical protein